MCDEYQLLLHGGPTQLGMCTSISFVSIILDRVLSGLVSKIIQTSGAFGKLTLRV